MSAISLPPTVTRWSAPLATSLLWAAAAASLVFWGLRLAAPPAALAPPPVAAAALPPDVGAVARAFGAIDAAAVVAAAPEAASRFVLLGVIADAEGQGAALIAVDGQPARPFRVGATLAPGFVLQSVGDRAAGIGGDAKGQAAFTLQLPARPLALPGPVPSP